jgi:hypothetical protein
MHLKLDFCAMVCWTSTEAVAALAAPCRPFRRSSDLPEMLSVSQHLTEMRTLLSCLVFPALMWSAPIYLFEFSFGAA